MQRECFWMLTPQKIKRAYLSPYFFLLVLMLTANTTESNPTSAIIPKTFIVGIFPESKLSIKLKNVF